MTVNYKNSEEAVMEQKLIHQLTHGSKQWDLRDDLKSISDLWDNFFNILAKNNKEQLNDVPLTENEKNIIKTKITCPTFFRAAKFMIGANRKVICPLKREDSTLPQANLLILNNQNISGGSSVYQVVHQIQIPKKVGIDQDRRFDVTLLINGLPSIHIELKAPQHPYMQAFNQIQKYIDEGKFNDIFCFVKMFVVTNGTNTRYIAADQKLNKQFLTSWVDNTNHQINRYLDFTKEVLSIPAAHHMIADYNVLDNNARKIIMLRPYQIHAIQAIIKASCNQQSGFIWHTTGSGKTLTSYKVARNLLQIPSIQKTIFLIDRKDLDTQTTMAFKIYANNDTININDTNNSYELINQLIDSKRNVIVTTRQKLQTIFKRIDNNSKDVKKYKKLKNKHFAFIVDECHRTVTPTQKRELDKFFNKQPLWYGFTGTPIFEENARKTNGQDARTTEEEYGPVLHSYTIEDAIRDKMVLGFKTENIGSSTNINENNTAKLNSMYMSTTHMKKVIKSILNLAYRKQGLMNNHRYSAIFTTSSIKQAQRYYKLFKEIKKNGEVPKRIQEVAPKFPRIAITYSVSQNNNDSEDNQSEMKASLNDYNHMFGTSFKIDNLSSYNRDVSNRLARKKKQYRLPGNQLDIVIVVDRLLTGFDAPSLSTLYIDRRPMNPQNIIQAFSRTNRLYDNNKNWGQIVTFQYPKKFNQDIDAALELYSNGGGTKALAPDWKTTKTNYQSSKDKLNSYWERYTDIANITNASEDEQREFAKTFQHFDQNSAAIQTYKECDTEGITTFDEEKLSALKGTYENVIEQLRKNSKKNTELFNDDEYELKSFHNKTIDTGYIMSLIGSYIPYTNKDKTINFKQKDINQINNYIKELAKTSIKLAEIVQSIWNDVQKNPHQYINSPIEQVLNDMVEQQIDKGITILANKYSLNYDDLKYVINNYDVNTNNFNQVGMNQLLNNNSFEAFRLKHPDSTLKIPLKWRKNIRKSINVYYEQKVKPLRDNE